MSVSIVTRKDRLITHFGIQLSSGNVLHFASKTNNMFAGNQIVRNDSFDEFAIQRRVKVLYRIKDVDEAVILKRSAEYYGNRKQYSLRYNNCITFILWCLQEKRNYGVFFVPIYYVRHVLLNWSAKKDT